VQVFRWARSGAGEAGILKNWKPDVLLELADAGVADSQDFRFSFHELQTWGNVQLLLVSALIVVVQIKSELLQINGVVASSVSGRMSCR